MRTALILLVPLSLALGALSYFSEFEIAPSGFVPTFRQSQLLTPFGLFQNLVLDRQDVWLQVFDMPTKRPVTLADPAVLLCYLVVAAIAGYGLWLLRRLKDRS